MKTQSYVINEAGKYLFIQIKYVTTPKRTTKRSPAGLKFLITRLNILIIKSLKQSRSAVKQTKIELNAPLKDYLIQKYELNNKFRKSSKIKDDLKLKKIRYFKGGLSAYTFNQINLETVELKIVAGKTVNYLNKDKLSRKLRQNSRLTFKFTTQSESLLFEVWFKIYRLNHYSNKDEI